MAGISDIVTITITSNSRTPTAAGFGLLLILAYHNHFPEKSRLYTDLSGMLTDGFVATEAAYLMAQSAFGQNPRPASVRVGRLPAAHTLTNVLTITSNVEGQHIKAKLLGPDGTINTLDYTVLAAATLTSVAVAVEALIEAYTGITSSASVADITITPATPGGVFFLYDLENCVVNETTADANYDDELSALQLIVDDWYYFILDTNSPANVALAAAWAETRTKHFFYQTSDYGERSGTGTLASALQSAAYTRTHGLYTKNASKYAQASLVGSVAPKAPGGVTLKFRNLPGVTPDTLTPTEETTLKGHNLNFYTTIAGLNVTIEGKNAAGGYTDIVIGTDALKARIQERVFGLLANADKWPYTDSATDAMRGEIFSVLEGFVAPPSLFVVDGSITVTAPLVASVSTENRANRILPDIKFAATLQGAVHSVRIEGTLSV